MPVHAVERVLLASKEKATNTISTTLYEMKVKIQHRRLFCINGEVIGGSDGDPLS